MVSYCSRCEQHKNFSILKSYVKSPGSGLPCEYTFACCDECGSPALFERQDYGLGFEFDDYYRVYPKNERTLNFDVPEIVRHSYEEAVKCENANIWTAAVVMAGRALEAVCIDAFPESKTVSSGFIKMKENGVISEELWEWSNELRVLRNLGADPPTERITYLDATEALDFLQAILETLYHLRPKFKQMKERRSNEGS